MLIRISHPTTDELSDRYLLLVTGLLILFVWSAASLYIVSSESNHLVLAPLTFVQAVAFTLISRNYVLGLTIFTLMGVWFALSIVVMSQTLMLFNFNYWGYLLISLASVVLHIVYGFVKKGRKKEHVSSGAPISQHDLS